jgi:hypothetical protein
VALTTLRWNLTNPKLLAEDRQHTFDSTVVEPAAGDDFWIERRLVLLGDTWQPWSRSSVRARIQPLGIPMHALLQGRLYVDFDEVWCEAASSIAVDRSMRRGGNDDDHPLSRQKSGKPRQRFIERVSFLG